MMRALVSLCVRHFGAVTALSIFALILGTWGAMRASLDVFPEFVPSQVDIQTEAPGFAPQQVEQLVTKQVENAVNGASGLATLRSESIPGLSVVTITFADGVDVHVARQGISERLSELGSSLPAGVGTPKLSPLVSSTMDLLKIGLLSDQVDAYTLRDTANWIIRPRLLAVPGVAHVLVFGGDVRQIQIQPDTPKLASFGISLSQISDAAHAALPMRGAGFIDLPAQRVLLKSPTPQPDIDALNQAVVTERNGTPILLRDLAEVKMAPALKFGDALVMGKPGVMMSLASQYGANTLTATLAVEKVLDDLEPALKAQGITLYSRLHRPANFIERALGDLKDSLAIAAILILAVLYLFLRDVRAALIAFTAIPLSLLAAIAVLNRLGLTLNTMTLGGFAVALGVLVDDAIIGIENILRRLRENGRLPEPKPRLEVLRDASVEVRGPVIYATAVVVAVFLPELFTSSVQGRFVGPLALAFIFAVVASLLVAMTVTPALCALLLRRHDARPEARWLVRLKAWQSSAVHGVANHFRLIAAVLIGLVIAALAALPFLGGTFMPDFLEGHFVMQVSSAATGTSLDAMLDMGKRISAEVLALPYVESIEQQVGRAELGEDTWGPHRSEFHVELKADAKIDQRAAQEELRKILADYPGLQSEVVTFLGDRISESLSGETAQVAVKVIGDDLDALDAAGDKIVGVLGKIPGVVDLQFKRQSGTPEIAIELVPQAMAATGLKVQDVLDTVEAAYAGAVVGQTFQATRTVDVVLLLPDKVRHQPSQLAKLMIASPSGPVPLSQIARLSVTQDRYSIEHDGGQRRISVTFNVGKGSLQDVVGQAQRAIAGSVVLPAGVFVEFTGAAEAELQTRNELVLYSGLALGLIVLILFVSFHWRANSWLVLANLPFSLIGGVMAIAATGIGISLGAVVGLVTVFGISARNAILQLAHYEHLVEVEGATWDVALVIRGANERFVPILMTAAVTALGLAPLAFGIHQPGQEIEGPMAITVLGGLFSSTLLNLFVLPALAQRYVRVRPLGSDALVASSQAGSP
ncbi:MAG TPA: efflux RND transporter permease subunit [Steroidobacteraceae bacterium]|jgi:CzcA family heavy metal efflux pump|nr:efflux RND transporter permease subunit [Steroidobacteraceae bacterium]